MEEDKIKGARHMGLEIGLQDVGERGFRNQGLGNGGRVRLFLKREKKRRWKKIQNLEDRVEKIVSP